MDFGLHWHQQELHRTARSVLDEACSTERLRILEASALGYAPETYRQMGDLGWLQMTLPPADGGTDDVVDLVVLYEAFGQCAAPGPQFISGLAARLVAAHGSPEQRVLLDALGTGRQVATLAVLDADADYAPGSVELRAEPRGTEVQLTGRKLFVPYVNGAEYLLVLARTGSAATELTFYLVPTAAAGVRVEPLAAISNDKLFEVYFDGVTVPAAAQLGVLHEGWAVLQAELPRATVLQSAELVGLSDSAFEMALEYSRQRIAFGKPIGAFQAIQHKLAEMLSDRDAARFMVYQAACLLNAGDIAAPEVLMAKAFAADAARRVIKEAHQIFGGAGFIMGHRLNYYYRRQKAIELAFADVDAQLDGVAARMGL